MDHICKCFTTTLKRRATQSGLPFEVFDGRQPFPELRPTALRSMGADRHGQSPALPDNDCDVFRI
jgi:hypothetical protein